MTEQELLQLIENVEQEELHQAPDYLKDMILRKANPPTKRAQLIIYSLKTIAATAAALMILFTIPQTTSVSENIIQKERIQISENIIQKERIRTSENIIQKERIQIQEEKIQMQEQIKKEIQRKKKLNYAEKSSITDILNQGTSYICNQLSTIFERKPINLKKQLYIIKF